MTKLCSVDGCIGKHRAKGLCRNHYYQLRCGKPEMPDLKSCQCCGETFQPLARARVIKFCSVRCYFFSHILKMESGCWHWQGTLNHKGYGEANFNKQGYMAHRLSWSMFNDCELSDKIILHSCDNPQCVNPDHLREGTNADNSADMVAKNRQANGPANGNNKLSLSEVLEILDSNESHRKLGIRYGVRHSTIGRIKRGDIWKIADKYQL